MKAIFSWFLGFQIWPSTFDHPQAHRFWLDEFFWYQQQQNITLKVLERILRVLDVNGVFGRLISRVVPISRERLMAPLCELLGVPKSRNIHFIGIPGQRSTKAEEMLKKWGTVLFPASRTSLVKIVLFQSIFSYCRNPVLCRLWEAKQLRNQCV